MLCGSAGAAAGARLGAAGAGMGPIVGEHEHQVELARSHVPRDVGDADRGDGLHGWIDSGRRCQLRAASGPETEGEPHRATGPGMGPRLEQNGDAHTEMLFLFYIDVRGHKLLASTSSHPTCSFLKRTCRM